MILWLLLARMTTGFCVRSIYLFTGPVARNPTMHPPQVLLYPRQLLCLPFPSFLAATVCRQSAPINASQIHAGKRPCKAHARRRCDCKHPVSTGRGRNVEQRLVRVWNDATGSDVSGRKWEKMEGVFTRSVNPSYLYDS